MRINKFLALAVSLNVISLSAFAQVFYPPSTNYFTHATVPMESAPIVTYDSPTTRPVAPTIPPNAAHGLEESSAVVVPAPRNTSGAAVTSRATLVTTPGYSYTYGNQVATSANPYSYGGRAYRYGNVYEGQRYHYGYGRIYGGRMDSKVRRAKSVTTPVYPQATLMFPNVPGMIMPAPVNGREAPRGAFTRFMTTPPTVSFTDELPVIVTISY